MQSDWPLVRLGDHVDACLGKMLDAKKNKGDMQPYLGNVNVRWGAFDLSDLSEMRFEPHEEERYGLLPGDLVVCEGGEPGRCAIWTGQVQRMKIQKALHRIRPKPSLDNYYLYYWFRHAANVGLLDAHFTGTTIKHLTGRAIASLQVPLPPVETQRASVDVLRRLDDRIDLLRQTNATLESIAQALFKSWFVDFDPVRAKAEGREPEGMDAATAALFPEGFEESALGLIPKGWETSTLGSLCELTKGCSYKGEGLSEEVGAFMFNLGCFNAQRVFATEKVKRYTGEYRPRHAVSPGELIIANTDMTQARDILGRPALVPHGFEPGFVSHHVFKVTVRAQGSHDPAALRHYLFFTFREPTFRERAIGFATGTTVLALPASAVTDCPACIPDAASLLAWNDIVQPLFGAIRLNEARAEQLVSLRNTLLPRLISGKLRTPEAQGQVEEALA